MKTTEPIRELRHLLYPPGSNFARKDYVLRWKWYQSAQIIIASVILGLVYPIFGDGFGSIIPYINGFAIGLLGGIAISVIELFLYPAFKRRFSFPLFVLFISVTYTLTITAFVFSVILVSRSIQFEMSVGKTLGSELFQHFILKEDFVIIIFYALFFALAVIFTREMSAKMGQGALWNFMTGKYRKPRQERRIFMFLDLDSSVSKAESLGDMEYHKLLNDFFFDISDCLLMSKGIIYQYVGDQVVVTWRVNSKTKPEDALRAFVSSVDKIEGLRSVYEGQYRVVPSFKAAFHVGNVITGEIGAVKVDIVFHGDVVNTTARLERMCSELGESLLISQDFYEMLPVPLKEVFERTETIKLKGKEKKLDIYHLKVAKDTMHISGMDMAGLSNNQPVG
jgi:adenylate cyclase